MLLERGTENGERGTGNGERGTGSGEWGVGSGERENKKMGTTQRIGNEVTDWARVQLQVRFCSHLSFSRLQPRSFPVPPPPPHLSNIPLSRINRVPGVLHAVSRFDCT